MNRRIRVRPALCILVITVLMVINQAIAQHWETVYMERVDSSFLGDRKINKLLKQRSDCYDTCSQWGFSWVRAEAISVDRLSYSSVTYKRQTRPLVREGAHIDRTATFLKLNPINKFLVICPRWGTTPRQTDWLTVSRNMTWLWLCSRRLVRDSSEILQ
jgi:hypothetical protein